MRSATFCSTGCPGTLCNPSYPELIVGLLSLPLLCGDHKSVPLQMKSLFFLLRGVQRQTDQKYQMLLGTEVKNSLKPTDVDPR